MPAFLAVSLALGIGSAHAANVSLIADGSFSAATGWSNGAAPSAGNNYSTGNFNLLTVHPSAANFTFGGDNLTIGSGTGLFVLRTTGVVTVNDLRINSGGVQNWGGSSTTLSGAKITLTGYGQISPSVGRTINITAPIEGTGQLRAKAGKVVLSGFNTYSGGTVVQTDATYPSWIEANGPDTLGTGNVTVQSGSKLSLLASSPTNTTNIIGDSASLILPSGLAASSIALSFNGTDRIAALSLDGGTTWVNAGTYGSLTSGASNKNAVFTGNGILAVGANVVANDPAKFGDTFAFAWSEEFNAASPDWLHYQSGMSHQLGNLVLTPLAATNGSWPRVQSADSLKKRFGRYEAVIYTDTPAGVCNAYYLCKPGAPPFQPIKDWQEIDILEIWDIGGIKSPQQNVYWGSNKQYSSESISGLHVPDGWHTWTLDWTPNHMLVYLDGVLIATKPSDSFNNSVARTLYPQVVHFSNWVINAATFSTTPPSLMLVDRFAYYALQYDQRNGAALGSSSGVTIDGTAVKDFTGVEGGATDWIRYDNVDLTKYRNMTLEIACDVDASTSATLPSAPQKGYSGKTVLVRTGSQTGTIIARVPIPYTDTTVAPDTTSPYNRFTQVSANLPTNLGSNVSLYLTFDGGGADWGTIREIRFHGKHPSSHSRETLIEAWNGEISTHPTNPAGPHGPARASGDYVNGLHGGPGSYSHFHLRYNNINFTGLTGIQLELGYNGSASPTKYIYLHKVPPGGTPSVGNRIYTLTVPNTGGYRKFDFLNAPLSGLSGTDDLYLTFSAFDCGNLRSLRFTR